MYLVKTEVSQGDVLFKLTFPYDLGKLGSNSLKYLSWTSESYTCKFMLISPETPEKTKAFSFFNKIKKKYMCIAKSIQTFFLICTKFPSIMLPNFITGFFFLATEVQPKGKFEFVDRRATFLLYKKLRKNKFPKHFTSDVFT